MASQGGFGRQCCFVANWFSVFVLVVTGRQPGPSVPDVGCGTIRFARFQKTPVLRYFSGRKIAGIAVDPQCELQAKEQASCGNISLATPKSETRKIAAAIHDKFSLCTRQVLSARNYSTRRAGVLRPRLPTIVTRRVSNRGSYESRNESSVQASTEPQACAQSPMTQLAVSF